MLRQPPFEKLKVFEDDRHNTKKIETWWSTVSGDKSEECFPIRPRLVQLSLSLAEDYRSIEHQVPWCYCCATERCHAHLSWTAKRRGKPIRWDWEAINYISGEWEEFDLQRATLNDQIHVGVVGLCVMAHHQTDWFRHIQTVIAQTLCACPLWCVQDNLRWSNNGVVSFISKWQQSPWGQS